MHKITGVTIEVHKEDRQLSPETDGYLGQLWSGAVIILAIIDPAADPVFALFRDGRDHYVQQKDWLNSPRTRVQRLAHARYLSKRKFKPGTRVYGIQIPLHVDEDRMCNRVSYPENMLMIAQYVRTASGRQTNRVWVWRVAIVSQHGEFFLTVQKGYDTTAHQNATGPCFPRFRAHKQLEELLIANMPKGVPPVPLRQFRHERCPKPRKLASNEGIVHRWYDARNQGMIMTAQGLARVHWTAAPPKPRRHFLVPGERVIFGDMDQPPINPKTMWRRTRKAYFDLQVSQLELA